LTNVTLTIDFPPTIGLALNCTVGSQQGRTCIMNVTEFMKSTNVTFNISVTNSTPDENYLINITLNYTNPGNEKKSWRDLQPLILEVRQVGLLAINMTVISENMTRGEQYDIAAYINNTNTTDDSTNVWFNYTLPAGFNTIVGVEKQFTVVVEDLNPGYKLINVVENY